MNKYLISIALQVEVEAFSQEDALEAVTDCYGEGDASGLRVTEFELLDHAELA